MVIPSSSTSSSEAALWRRFVSLSLATLVGLAAVSYGFVLLMDPYDSLPFSLPIDRVQVADQQRLFYPALARRDNFDSAVIGNSNIRLLRPDLLNDATGGRWVNLAINAASSWEQEQVFNLFLSHHPQPQHILIGMDYLWCYQRYADRKFVGATREQDFPAWLFDEVAANNLPPLNLGSIEHSWLLLLHIAGIKTAEFGSNGYTVFTDPDEEYDVTEARREIYGSGKPKPIVPVTPPIALTKEQRSALNIPALERLQRMLEKLPDSTSTTLMFVPYHSYYQARPGSRQAALWNECKARVSAIATHRGNTRVLDYMLQTDITAKDSNYWDYKHYRVSVGNIISREIGSAINAKPPTGNYKVLVTAKHQHP
ncbi:hypothetical protein EYC98_01150 [Halieaceae bacterium IMCC14734]|uniref:Uncharacterized protein n=1 Tax=Candidatus Litorirhabdus singularis TaxID=2518993 RepID=A0ABT3TB13_9GAMM|nr:hypothetical protein [Candidatus Litorirhabdus singularis]MCX2979462.1 hypothetical protein [Candidatus Litorirhabdus singularis]